MILIAGIPSEGPIALAIEAAEHWGIGFIVLDQRAHRDWELTLVLDPHAGCQGRLTGPDGAIVDLAEISGVYARMMDHRVIPAAPSTADPGRADRFHYLFNAWLDVMPGRVANRPRAMMSNMSKSYQAGLIAGFGFAVPETLITNDPQAASDFIARCREGGDDVIYKSVSGTRSIVQSFTKGDGERLGRIRWCPTQFQRRVAGVDYRAHVVGGRVFATRIESAATDYRYAARQTGAAASLEAADLPREIEEACVALATGLDLPFTGIDLRRTPEGEFVCFEANPSPAFSYYEDDTGAPIARALARWLAGYDEAE